MAAIHSACCCQFAWLKRDLRATKNVHYTIANRLHGVGRLGQEGRQRQARKHPAVQVQSAAVASSSGKNNNKIHVHAALNCRFRQPCLTAVPSLLGQQHISHRPYEQALCRSMLAQSSFLGTITRVLDPVLPL